MKVSEIYRKTLKFVWLKLGLNVLTILLSVVWLAICLGLAALFHRQGIFLWLILWLAGTACMNTVINHYIGYLVKAGHIAVVTYTIKNGQLPENMMEFAKQTVKNKFVESSVYFGVDRLISGAVSQIQHAVGKIDSLLGNIPGVGTIVSLLNLFIGIALNYVDECCLGYTFYCEEETNVFKNSADGVVIYFQNWKTLLKNAAKLVLVVVAAVVITTILSFALLGGLFTAFGWNRIFAFLIASFFALAVKHSFIDSYLCISMMCSYLSVAPKTVITFDLYEKLCGFSRKFRSMFEKAGITNSGMRTASAANPGTSVHAAGTVAYAVNPPDAKANVTQILDVCPNCGKRLRSGAAFCSACGMKRIS